MARVRKSQVQSAFIKVVRKRTAQSVLMFVVLAAVYMVQLQDRLFTGGTQVHDGDSLRINDQKFRIFGIDAPELDQTCTRNGASWPCGKASRDYLTALIAKKEVVCEQKDTSYDRIVAICHAGGVDLAREMVRGGMAIALPQYSMLYVKDQEKAKRNLEGIWSGKFMTPSRWRHKKK